MLKSSPQRVAVPALFACLLVTLLGCSRPPAANSVILGESAPAVPVVRHADPLPPVQQNQTYRLAEQKFALHDFVGADRIVTNLLSKPDLKSDDRKFLARQLTIIRRAN